MLKCISHLMRCKLNRMVAGMQLLIVDDESIIIDDLKLSMEWNKFGIVDIFEANNIRQAKEVIAANNIDIMLCDIEMPQGSGLELLAWVKEHRPQMESVFLTCHADFSYAKEAIRLGSLDYLLKPVPYDELEKVIIKAVEKIQSKSRLMETSRYGEFWFKHQPMVIERFWSDVLNRSIKPEVSAINDAAEARNIPYSSKMKFIPILFSIRRWHGELSLQELKSMEFEFKNMISESLLKDGSEGQVIETEKGKMVLILSLWNTEGIVLEDLVAKCNQCIATCNQSLNCDISGHIGEECYANELSDLVDLMQLQERNNVAFDNRVFTLRDHCGSAEFVSMPDLSIWSMMLSKGSKEALIADITGYLEILVQKNMFNATCLRLIQHDFIQMTYTVMGQRGILAHELLSDSQTVKLYDRSKNSVKDLIIWIKHVVTKVVDYAVEVNKSENIVTKVKKYIALNLELDLTRDDIANHFYLNPDYLDRIFKKETGISVTKYMLHQRLDQAKELLDKTEMSISTIAVTVGFKNMSHFSNAFKKYAENNPIDYRKQIHIKKEGAILEKGWS